MIYNRNAVGNTFSLIHVVRCQKNRDPFWLFKVRYVCPELVAALRVQTQRRLIEEKNFDAVKKTLNAINAIPP